MVIAVPPERAVVIILRVSCNGCGSAAYVDCACESLGHDTSTASKVVQVGSGSRTVPAHHPACPFDDLGATVVCPPGSGCCDGSAHPDMSHDAYAMTCEHIDIGTHGDCPEPGTCKSWYGMHDHRYEHVVNETAPPPCPGGHCHQDLPDCTVCRTVTIEVLPGNVQVGLGV
jgi:hypothetical protein